MNTCSTCRWWAREDHNGNESQNCLLAASENGGPIHKQSLAVAYDNENYSANLATKPDFGCNQWEGKDE